MKSSFIEVLALALAVMVLLSACSSTGTVTPTDRENASRTSDSTAVTSASSNTPAPANNAAPAADWPDTPISDFDYEYSGELKGVVITSYNGTNALKVRIPDTIEGERVVAIGTGKAMNGWTAGAFHESGIMSVYFPDTTTTIFERAFRGSGLTSLTLPDSVTTVGKYAFADCNGLTEVTISAGVVELDSRAFSYCTKLTHIYVSPDNPAYTDIDGVVFSKDKTSLLIYPSGRTETSYVVPVGVTMLGDDVFAEDNLLESVVLPDSVIKLIDSGLSTDLLDDDTMRRLIKAGSFTSSGGGALPAGYYCDSCGAGISALPTVCESCDAVVRHGVHN